MANKEIQMIEMAKKMYNIDFSDHERIMQQALNEDRNAERQQLEKKINICRQSLETNKKNYSNNMKVILKRRKDQEV